MIDIEPGIKTIENKIGKPLFVYQKEAAALWMGQRGPQRRLCLYYKTGAGKTLTSLVLCWLAGSKDVLVVAPPITHAQWLAQARTLRMTVTCISHAKFRQPGYLVKRDRAVIADEFHLFGGHDGQGWKKLDRLARGLQAPLILASATPNYNDAERVYCIQHVLDPHSVKGGYIEFLYKHCKTEQNMFSKTPLVSGFLNYPDAASYLAALPHVVHLPDDVQIDIDEVYLSSPLPKFFDTYGLDVENRRIMASGMEQRHTRNRYLLVNNERIWPHIMDELEKIRQDSATPVLMFCKSSRIAEALWLSWGERGVRTAIITGQITLPTKNRRVNAFKGGHLDVLVGTATLGTGTDGLDKVSDTLILVHDTDDDAFRRQLIGRILPRGEDSDISKKKVIRLNMTPA